MEKKWAIGLAIGVVLYFMGGVVNATTYNPTSDFSIDTGKGNGRVYQISFTADDGNGGQCSGSVDICVPHDQSPSSLCISDGQKYSSIKEEWKNNRKGGMRHESDI